MPIEKLLFRQVLGNFASGVTVITTAGVDQKPYGLTATAFTSVSILPPLVLACVDKNSETYPHLRVSGIFAANFLTIDQQVVSQRFATSGGDKFFGIKWHPGKLGAPILEDTLGYVECRIEHAYDGGDHTIYVGLVEDAAAHAGEPLIYFRGGYRRVVDVT